jgi:hypothetical protein
MFHFKGCQGFRTLGCLFLQCCKIDDKIIKLNIDHQVLGTVKTGDSRSAFNDLDNRILLLGRRSNVTQALANVMPMLGNFLLNAG